MRAVPLALDALSPGCMLQGSLNPMLLTPACKDFTLSVEAVGINTDFFSFKQGVTSLPALSRGHPAYLIKEGKPCSI